MEREHPRDSVIEPNSPLFSPQTYPIPDESIRQALQEFFTQVHEYEFWLMTNFGKQEISFEETDQTNFE